MVPLDVIVWALLGSSVAALTDFERRATPPRRPLLRVLRIVLVGALSGVAISSLVVSTHHVWALTPFAASDRWAVAFLIAAGSGRRAARRFPTLRALRHRPWIR